MATKSEGPVLLSFMKEPPEAQLECEGLPDAWFRLDVPLRPWPEGRVRAVVGGPALAKRAPKIVAVDVHDGFVVRRSLVAPALAEVDAREVTLRAVALADKRGTVVDEDFAFLDVRTLAPLDRRGADADWKGGGGFLDRLRAARWGEGRRPRAAIFRIAEAWGQIAAQPALAEALARATGKWIGARPVAPAELFQRAVSSVHPQAVAPLGAGVASEDAYWRLVSGSAAARDRDAACAHPMWAFHVAHTVDKRRAADTRAGAARHPVAALLYACLVDGKPSPAARKAVAGDWWAAKAYAYLLERALHPSLEPELRDAGEDLDELRDEIGQLRACFGR